MYNLWIILKLHYDWKKLIKLNNNISINIETNYYCKLIVSKLIKKYFYANIFIFFKYYLRINTIILKLICKYLEN